MFRLRSAYTNSRKNRKFVHNRTRRVYVAIIERFRSTCEPVGLTWARSAVYRFRESPRYFLYEIFRRFSLEIAYVIYETGRFKH